MAAYLQLGRGSNGYVSGTHSAQLNSGRSRMNPDLIERGVRVEYARAEGIMGR